MSLTLPWIFHYGKTGEFIFFYANEGQPFHLWFLWQLIIFVIFTAILRLFYLGVVGVAGGLRRIGLGYVCRLLSRSRSISSGILFRSRFPLVFIILCCVVNLPTQGELIFNPIASALYFTVGLAFTEIPIYSTF